MEVKNAVAGTLESGDIMVQIGPAKAGAGLVVDLELPYGGRLEGAAL